MAGAILWATYGFLQRDAKLTHLAFAWQDLVQGHEIQMINNSDKSRMFAFVAMHKDKLYIFEASVPGNLPPPGLFQQSVGWVDRTATAFATSRSTQTCTRNIRTCSPASRN